MSRKRIYPPKPLGYIQAVLATVSVIGGLYLLSPLLIHSLSPVALALTQKFLLLGFGVSYLSSGIALFVGIYSGIRPLRKWSLFAFFCFTIFTQILAVIFNGWLPPRWIAPTALGSIAGILYLNIKHDEKEEHIRDG